MDIKEVKILGVNINNLSTEDLKNVLIKESSSEEPSYIVTPNPEIVYLASLNQGFKDILNKAKYRIPDGIGLIIASRILGKPLKERVSGVDVFDLLGDLGRIKVYLLGSREEVVKKTAEKLKEKYSNIDAIEYHNGYFNQEQNDYILDKIRKFKPNLLLVGLGYPKQEKWIFENYKNSNANVTIGIGGSFDVISGFKRRASIIVQKMCLEWLYRFLQEPQKRIKRIIILPLFLIKIIKQRFLS